MAHINETFFTSVGCMDGRVQDPIEDLGRARFHALFHDTLTLITSLKKKLLISLEKHHSRGILVHGHQECAGNPVPDEIHIQNILRAADIISELIDHKVPVIAVFVKRKGDEWVAREIDSATQALTPVAQRNHNITRFLHARPLHFLSDHLRFRQVR